MHACEMYACEMHACLYSSQTARGRQPQLDGQTARQPDSHSGRQISSRAGKQTVKQPNRQRERQPNMQTAKQPNSVMRWIRHSIVVICYGWLVAMDGFLPRLFNAKICVAWKTRQLHLSGSSPSFLRVVLGACPGFQQRSYVLVSDILLV
jgi:hypothetical protein